MWAHPGKQLLFMGPSSAQEREWAEPRGLDWWLLDDPGTPGLQQLVRDLNRLYRRAPRPVARWTTTRPASSGSTPTTPADNTFSFLRWTPTGAAAGVARQLLRDPRTRATGSGCPTPGRWREVLNTDAEGYGGSGVGNFGDGRGRGLRPWHGRPASAQLRVPPLGAVWLVPAED